MSNRRKTRPGPRVLIETRTHGQRGQRGADGIRQVYVQTSAHRVAVPHSATSGRPNSTVDAVKGVKR